MVHAYNPTELQVKVEEFQVGLNYSEKQWFNNTALQANIIFCLKLKYLKPKWLICRHYTGLNSWKYQTSFKWPACVLHIVLELTHILATLLKAKYGISP